MLALQDWQGASLTDLVRDQLAPFVEAGSARLSVSGSSIFLGPKAAEAIGLALHELATNAVKYGALSSPAGRVTVSWDWKTSATEPRLLQMSWEERGGPPVSLPTSKGFGHVVFGRIVTEILDGKVEMDFAPQGLNWKLLIPTRNLVTEQAAARDWFASSARLSERRTVSD